MKTFLSGLLILVIGAALYGKFCEKVFGPDDRKTPVFTKQDGVDYIPMKGWKNSLINLLNIAGTGPIFGPIQGILFGPLAYVVLEGFIAMVWAAAAMGVYNLGLQAADANLYSSTVGIVCRDILGSVGGVVALFRLVKPDPVPVCVPCDFRVDV